MLDLEKRGDLLDLGADDVSRNLVGGQRARDVVERRHVRKEREVLERHSDAARLGRLVGDVAAAEQNTPLVGLLDAGDKPQQHGLARSRRPENRDDLAILGRKRNPVEHLARLELLADRPDLDIGHD